MRSVRETWVQGQLVTPKAIKPEADPVHTANLRHIHSRQDEIFETMMARSERCHCIPSISAMAFLFRSILPLQVMACHVVMA